MCFLFYSMFSRCYRITSPLSNREKEDKTSVTCCGLQDPIKVKTHLQNSFSAENPQIVCEELSMPASTSTILQYNHIHLFIFFHVCYSGSQGGGAYPSWYSAKGTAQPGWVASPLQRQRRKTDNHSHLWPV